MLIKLHKYYLQVTYTYLHPSCLLTKICFTYLPTIYLPIYISIYIIYRHTYLWKIKVQMLLYTLTKNIIEVKKMLNAFGIVEFYKVV
jgi:hypothetical protein